MISGTATSTGPRRARAGVVIAGGFPGSKRTEVLSLDGMNSWVLKERLRHSRSCTTGYSGCASRRAGEVLDI